jgi:hypothetical protein
MLDQTTIPLSKVPDWVNEHAGFKPHRATIFRWKTRGCNGRKLATFKVGGRVCTTIEALLGFFEIEESAHAPSLSRSPNSASESFLESEGI